MKTQKINPKINKEDIICSINITNKTEENQLLIGCQTNFNNNNLYSSILNIKNFLQCSSADEAIDILTKYFYRKIVYVKGIKDDLIALGIPFINEFDDICSINELNINNNNNDDNINHRVFIFT